MMNGSSAAVLTGRDRGFTLIEVVVAFALFAVMATALLVVVNTSQQLTREDAARVVAQNLASRELEITRDAFSGVTRGPTRVATNRVVNPNPLPGGAGGEPLVVDGVAYTLVRSAQWASVGSAASACDDGSSAELAYLRVRVEVSWPELGSRPPVRMDTIMTPAKGSYSATAGHIGLKVIDRLGHPRAGVTVTTSGVGANRSAQTAADGCVLFSFLDPGSYTVSLSNAGEVDPAGNPTSSRTVQVQAGQLWRGTQEYDRSATIAATLRTTEGFALPTEVSKIPLSLGNSALLPNGSRAVAGSSSTRTLTDLWPYPSGYQLWAGGCADSDPGDAKGAATAADPGLTNSATVEMPPLEVTTPGPNQQVQATHEADSVCASAVTLSLGTSTGTTLLTSLPYGTWTLRRPSSSGPGTSVTIAPPPPVESGATPASPPVTRASVG